MHISSFTFSSLVIIFGQCMQTTRVVYHVKPGSIIHLSFPDLRRAWFRYYDWYPAQEDFKWWSLEETWNSACIETCVHCCVPGNWAWEPVESPCELNWLCVALGNRSQFLHLWFNTVRHLRNKISVHHNNNDINDDNYYFIPTIALHNMVSDWPWFIVMLGQKKVKEQDVKPFHHPFLSLCLSGVYLHVTFHAFYHNHHRYICLCNLWFYVFFFFTLSVIFLVFCCTMYIYYV